MHTYFSDNTCILDVDHKAVCHHPPSLALQPAHGVELDIEDSIVHTGATASHSEHPKPSTSSSIATITDPSPEDGAMATESIESELQAMKYSIEHDQPDPSVVSTKIVRKYPNLIFPSGPLKKKSHSFIYTSLFKMAWGGDEDKARTLMRHFRHNDQIPIDLKIVSMEVVHTVNTDKDLKVLTSALAYTDRSTCENKVILKCRLHRRIAGLHYRNQDLEEANEHMETALQLAHQIGPDIDTIYTMRLKALMLFEEYKKNREHKTYKDANKFFNVAMDHARRQPESKRIITERVKVSKALFHLDMRKEYQQQNKSDEVLEELQFRAQDTLDDVEEEYLTDADKAFYHMTRAKLFLCNRDWQAAELEARKALDLNQKCGFDTRVKETQELLRQIDTSRNSAII